MVGMDVFRADPFKMIQLTSAIEKVPYVPDGLEAMGIFEDTPIRTQELWVEERSGTLSLIPFSERGAPAKQRTTERRKAKAFKCPRIKESDTIYAHEIANIRDMGQETALMQVQKEVARRTVGPTGLRNQLRYTQEFHKLAAIQGKLLDADGSVLYDWFDEFGISENAAVPFDLVSKTSGTLRPACAALTRAMARKAQGAFRNTSSIVALCGDAFYDALVTHPDVEKAYANWQAATALAQGTAFRSDFRFADITWVNYRGSDDTITASCTTTASSKVITPASVAGLSAGMSVSGYGVPDNTTIAAIDSSAGTVTLSAAFTGTAGTYYFNFGGGISGGGDIAIAANKARFFPVKAPGIFQRALSPAEAFDFINTLGKEEYLRQIPDRDRNEWVEFEMEAYPLHICTRPEVLFEGVMEKAA